MVWRYFVAAAAAAMMAFPEAAKTVRLSGEVRQGETYSHQLKSGLMFCLIPESDYGWNIMIAVTCDRGAHNFSGIATPPYHGVNPTQLMSWHFVPDATLWTVRSFQFILSDRDYQPIWSMLRRKHDAGQLLKLVSRLGRGKGELRVLKAETAPSSSKERPRFVYLRFSATLLFPSEN